MCSRFCFCVLLALCALLRGDDGKDVPSSALREIIRRGSLVEVCDGVSAEPHLAAALQVPPDDSGKFHLTLVVTKGCKFCEQLRSHWASSPFLLAWADPDPKKYRESWAHFDVVQIEDASQAWRWKDFRPDRFPTLILQPPTDRSYGDPRTIIASRSDYDGNPERLATWLRSSMDAYVQKFFRREGGHGQSAVVAERAAGDWRPPSPPPAPLAPAPALVPPSPAVVVPPAVGPNAPSLGPGIDLLVSLLAGLLPDAKTFWLVIMSISNVLLYMIEAKKRASVPAQELLPGVGQVSH